ncbi:unnamed protein product [Linum tenue]|uniref:Uncharacterized protein n=1 Tax=Linum tenue TaxID=586396 RepID=A0AAV0NQF2_9ROSI|nr:unnamed protein product [Linum tenue]
MGRTPCCHKNGLKKGPWTTEEDHKLTSYIHMHGPANWRTLPKNAGLQRCGKSCRLRWTNYLRPDIKRGRFAFEEEETIIQLHSILGNKWSAIAARLPGRTDNEIKNYWNTHIRKRLLRNGIDPVTHAPRLDHLDLSAILGNALCHVNPAASLLALPPPPPSLINPELLRIAAALASLKQENPELYLQRLQESQLAQHQQTLTDPQTTPSQLTQQQQVELERFLELNNNNNSNNGDDNSNSGNEASRQDNFVSLPNDFGFWNTIPELSDWYYQHNLISGGSGGNVSNANSSVMSTPLSSPAQVTPTSSTFLNGSLSASTTTEDERESYCSSLLKFEIPESLELLDDFM